MTRAADTQTTACLPTGSQWLGVQFSLGWPMLKIYPVRRALVWAGARFFWSRFWFVLLSCKLLKWLPWSENKVEVNTRRFSKILRNIFIRKLSFDNRPSFTVRCVTWSQSRASQMCYSTYWWRADCQSKYVAKQHAEKAEKDRQDTRKQQSAGQVLYDG